MNDHDIHGQALSRALIALMKGVVYRDGDEEIWQALLNVQTRVRDYVLDQLRCSFPSAYSLMMDRTTLPEHQVFWKNEDRPVSRQLEHLQTDELALYDDLRLNRIAPSLRLEQERIGFAWVMAELERNGLK